MRPAVAPLLAALVTALLAGCADDETGSGEEPSVVGIPWTLAGGLDVEGWETVAPTAVFDATTLTGSTGCNRYTGSYTADRATLELGSLATTRKACPPPADAVELAFLARLEQVAGWRLEEAELVLVDDNDTELLRFREATPAGAWEATAIRKAKAVTSPLPGTTLTARFESDGTLSGSAGCNSYRASYTTDRGSIEIGPTAATKKACTEPDGVMEQETAFLESLATAARYLVEGSALSLLRADRTIVASFTRS